MHICSADLTHVNVLNFCKPIGSISGPAILMFSISANNLDPDLAVQSCRA